MQSIGGNLENHPSCLSLLPTWLLAILMIIAINSYGVVGLMLGLVLLTVGQRVRGEHDQIFAKRVLQSKRWKAFFTIYYLFILGPIVIYSVLEHIYLSRLPVMVFVLLLGFPVIVAMLINDLSNCGNKQNR